MQKKALFIGRFQPLHLGHLFSIKCIAEEYDLMILVGSKQYSDSDKNPFSFEERENMIRQTLGIEGIDFELYGLDDIHDNKRWPIYVKSNLPDFDILFSSNELVRKLFKGQGVEVKESFFELDISGKKIRDMIRADNEAWETYVHPLTAEYIKRIDGVKRIKNTVN